MRGEAGAMTNIYKNIYLRKEEEVLYNIRKNVDETVETPTISKIIDYVLADPYEHIIYMDVKLKMVTSYDATMYLLIPVIKICQENHYFCRLC